MTTLNTEVPQFTSHNIAFPGMQTRPGTPLLTDTGIYKAVARTLDVAFTGWAREGVHIADLGCLEGGYTVALARVGYQAQGIEANDDNFEACRWVQEQLGYPANLTFVKADVREYLNGHWWDAILCSGLLYHMDNPAGLIKMMGRSAKRLLILNTHYAPDAKTVHEGLDGEWVDDDPVARWGTAGNTRSFWVTKPHLIRALRQAGFHAVYEQVDYFNDGGTGYVDHHGSAYVNRCVLVGLKQ